MTRSDGSAGGRRARGGDREAAMLVTVAGNEARDPEIEMNRGLKPPGNKAAVYNQTQPLRA